MNLPNIEIPGVPRSKLSAVDDHGLGQPFLSWNKHSVALSDDASRQGGDEHRTMWLYRQCCAEPQIRPIYEHVYGCNDASVRTRRSKSNRTCRRPGQRRARTPGLQEGCRFCRRHECRNLRNIVSAVAHSLPTRTPAAFDELDLRRLLTTAVRGICNLHPILIQMAKDGEPPRPTRTSGGHILIVKPQHQLQRGPGANVAPPPRHKVLRRENTVSLLAQDRVRGQANDQSHPDQERGRVVAPGPVGPLDHIRKNGKNSQEILNSLPSAHGCWPDSAALVGTFPAVGRPAPRSAIPYLGLGDAGSGVRATAPVEKSTPSPAPPKKLHRLLTCSYMERYTVVTLL